MYIWASRQTYTSFSNTLKMFWNLDVNNLLLHHFHFLSNCFHCLFMNRKIDKEFQINNAISFINVYIELIVWSFTILSPPFIRSLNHSSKHHFVDQLKDTRHTNCSGDIYTWLFSLSFPPLLLNLINNL